MIDSWELEGPTFQEIAGVIKGLRDNDGLHNPFNEALFHGGWHWQIGGWAPYIPTNNNKTTKLQDMISSIKSTWNLQHLFMIIGILL